MASGLNLLLQLMLHENHAASDDTEMPDDKAGEGIGMIRKHTAKPGPSPCFIAYFFLFKKRQHVVAHLGVSNSLVSAALTASTSPAMACRVASCNQPWQPSICMSQAICSSLMLPLHCHGLFESRLDKNWYESCPGHALNGCLAGAWGKCGVCLCCRTCLDRHEMIDGNSR